ncbi:hypothetical protein Ocin01_02012 [Orchesella cincta]|uniref:Protein quiver n=1 Tax=Orchesella cincta TaxID=48709 RepID=A0A1D2NHG2_ORCCI|nr:hypothetical protein Ocin01_02012 [Orchesella cincta]
MFSTYWKCTRVTLLLIITSEIVLADFNTTNTTKVLTCYTCELLGCFNSGRDNATWIHITPCPPDHKCYKQNIRKLVGHYYGIWIWNKYIYAVKRSCINTIEADAILANVNNTCKGPFVDEDFEQKECICDTHLCNKTSLAKTQLLSVVLGSLYAFLLGGVILR